MFKVINIFSNFNTHNICQNLEQRLRVRVYDYSYSEIIQQLNNNKLKNKFNIFFINIDNYEIKILKGIIDNLASKSIDCLIIPFSIEDISASFNILNGETETIHNKTRELENYSKNNKKLNDSFHIVNFLSLCKKFNNKVFNYKNWFLYKNPFTKAFELDFINFLENFINVKSHKRKKAIFVDLDDTLWGGEIAELGYKKIKIGNDNPVSEAHYIFQKSLKRLKESGIILGIISKNYENVALEGFKNKSMLLKKSDFAGWEINFDKKSNNIEKLCKKLNISPDTVVFMDNSYYERNEVRSKLSDVLVPELLDEPYEYFKVAQDKTMTNYISLSKEDQLRSASYQFANKKKKDLNHKDWLKSLNMVCTIEKMNNDNLDRCAQMQERINQINLKTKRLNKLKLKKLIKDKNFYNFTFSLKDKYTDLGIVAYTSIRKTKKEIILDDFLMSCRSFGRDLEQNIFYFLKKNILKSNNEKIDTTLIKSKKNMLCKEILDKNLVKVGSNKYIIDKNIKDNNYIKNVIGKIN
jgi:FkbH-like protein